MARVLLAVIAAVFIVLVQGGTAPAAPGAVPLTAAAPVAAVAWPPSGGLLVAEVVTGGASASDEYVELANAGTVPLDLDGLEVVYVTSSGATVTRKAAWTTSVVVEPGRHVLLANSLGAFASLADVVYSGGLAGTGGSIVLRVVGGSPLDAIGWGDATNAFVEGAAAPAPPAGSAIERLPGGTGGNRTDTNDNASDVVVTGAPVPQNLAAAPAPGPTQGPSPTPTPDPTVAPTASPSPSPEPTVVPTPTPTPDPTPVPTPQPTATPSPTLVPTPVPTPDPTPQPTPMPTATPVPTPDPTPTPVPTSSPDPTPVPTGTPMPTAEPSATPAPTPLPVLPIADARARSDGDLVTIEGVLTTALGALESGRSGFAQDATGGIALYLDAVYPAAIPSGSLVRASGSLDTRYGQRTLRVDGTAVDVIVDVGLPDAIAVSTGAATEPLEGQRLEVAGIVTESPDDLADGLGLTVDDGTGPVRVIVGSDALGGLAPTSGDVVVARGPLGQRDSSGTGTTGYRVHATLAGELEIEAAPSPSPTITPAPSPTPSVTPTPTPSSIPTAPPTATAAPTATPIPTVVPTPTPTTTPLTVAAARLVAVGDEAFVRGVVVAEAGRLGTPALLVIADATGGMPVRLPDGVSPPGRGTAIEVRGKVADPYGQTELRPAASGIGVVGTGPLPAPLAITAAQADESTEGRLATIHGTVTAAPAKATSGDIAFTITGPDGTTLRILADASAGIDHTILRKGTSATFTGVVGQRASRKGALDGYRLWPRDRADITSVSQPGTSPSPSPITSASPGSGSVLRISTALLREGQRVSVEGVLTVDRLLLDASGRRTIVQDSSGAVEAYLPAADTAMRPGVRVRLTGTMGRAWGAPRLTVIEARVLGSGSVVAQTLTGAPGAATEWRLARVAGTIADVHRSGDRWTAEIRTTRGIGIPVSGLAGSGIAATLVVEGRTATVTGIVKRPYPTATDRRFAIVPRAPSDLELGPASPAATGSSVAGAQSPLAGAGSPAPGIASGVPDTDLRDLAAHVGQRVRVGGLVTGLEADGLRLDDGTAVARVVLADAAAEVLELVGPGDALNAVGVPERRDEIVLVVGDVGDVELVGDLGGAQAMPARAVTEGDPAGDAVPAAIGRGMGIAPASVGLAALALVATVWLAITIARRRRSQRLLRERIRARIDALAVSPAADLCAAPAGPEGPPG